MVQDQPSAGEGQQGVVARHVIANAGVGLDFRVGIVDNLNVAIVAGLVLGDGGNVVVKAIVFTSWIILNKCTHESSWYF
jgi:hypothetical protein